MHRQTGSASRKTERNIRQFDETCADIQARWIGQFVESRCVDPTQPSLKLVGAPSSNSRVTIQRISCLQGFTVPSRPIRGTNEFPIFSGTAPNAAIAGRDSRFGLPNPAQTTVQSVQLRCFRFRAAHPTCARWNISLSCRQASVTRFGVAPGILRARRREHRCPDGIRGCGGKGFGRAPDVGTIERTAPVNGRRPATASGCPYWRPCRDPAL